MSIKAALFDLDGTLLDTQKIYDEINQKLLIYMEIKRNMILIQEKM